jgi:hypothetical protein
MAGTASSKSESVRASVPPVSRAHTRIATSPRHQQNEKKGIHVPRFKHLNKFHGNFWASLSPAFAPLPCSHVAKSSRLRQAQGAPSRRPRERARAKICCVSAPASRMRVPCGRQHQQSGSRAAFAPRRQVVRHGRWLQPAVPRMRPFGGCDSQPENGVAISLVSSSVDWRQEAHACQLAGHPSPHDITHGAVQATLALRAADRGSCAWRFVTLGFLYLWGGERVRQRRRPSVRDERRLSLRRS